MNIDEILNNSERFQENIDSNNTDFILSIIGKCAQNNGTEVYITKKSNEEFKNLELASMQSLFTLGTQNKYELHFNFGEEENEKILNSQEKQELFIKKYKTLIAKDLNIDEQKFIFKDIHRGSVNISFLHMESTKELNNSLYKLKGKYK